MIEIKIDFATLSLFNLCPSRFKVFVSKTNILVHLFFKIKKNIIVYF